MKVDLHVHTCYSIDCCTPLERIVDRCIDKGIECIAVADHNTIAGALKLKEIAPFKVIVAEEVLTPVGELMGLFLTEEIPKGLSPQETIARIKRQGGLVNIPHPFGRSFFWNSNVLTSPEILMQVDVIEAFNSRTPFANSFTKARELAAKYNKPIGAGSDAHTVGEIGKAYVEMSEFNGPEDFLACLSQGKIYGRKSSPLIHFASTRAKLGKRLGFYPNPNLSP